MMNNPYFNVSFHLKWYFLTDRFEFYLKMEVVIPNQ